MKTPRRFSYVPKRNDFASQALYDAFVAALRQLETDGDSSLLGELMQGGERLPLAAQNAIGELFSGALIGGEIEEIYYNEEHRAFVSSVGRSWGYAVKIVVKRYALDLAPYRQGRLNEKLAKEVHELILAGVKRADAKAQVRRRHIVGTATIDAAVRDYEQEHGPMGRDSRGRKPSH